MADNRPSLLNTKPLTWYQGLSKYQWWVLIIASMGWMFDTMDQQFFNLGRGPAMKQVLKYDPLEPGLEKLGKGAPARYSPTDLDALVAKGIVTADQKRALLTDDGGKTRQYATRRDVAATLGETILAPKFIALGNAKLAENQITADAFDQPALDEVVAKDVLSAETIQKQLAMHPSGTIPKAELARYIGKEIAKAQADKAGDNATFIFVMGWAVGGLFFGWVGDSLGRAKTINL